MLHNKLVWTLHDVLNPPSYVVLLCISPGYVQFSLCISLLDRLEPDGYDYIQCRRHTGRRGEDVFLFFMLHTFRLYICHESVHAFCDLLSLSADSDFHVCWAALRGHLHSFQDHHIQQPKK